MRSLAQLMRQDSDEFGPARRLMEVSLIRDEVAVALARRTVASLIAQRNATNQHEDYEAGGAQRLPPASIRHPQSSMVRCFRGGFLPRCSTRTGPLGQKRLA